MTSVNAIREEVNQMITGFAAIGMKFLVATTRET